MLPAEHGNPSHASWERDVFSIVDTDPARARALSERRIEITRGDWHTKVDAYAEMTCDAENFYVTTRLSAMAGEDEVFSAGNGTWRFVGTHL